MHWTCWNCGAGFKHDERLMNVSGDTRCPDCASSECKVIPNTTVGTAHFHNFDCAVKYYRTYGFTRTNVKGKIECGEIYIGEPPVPEGATLKMDTDGRYHVRN